MTKKEDKDAGKLRLPGYYLDPEEILIPGLDSMPPGLGPGNVETWNELDDQLRLRYTHGRLEWLRESIKTLGVQKPVIAIAMRATGGDRKTYYVAADGRCRIQVCRTINKDLRHKGDSNTIRIPAIVREADQSLTIIANEGAITLTALQRAYKVDMLKKRNRSTKEICAHFADNGRAVSPQTITNWHSLLRLPREVQDALEAEQISYSSALAVAQLDKSARDQAVKALLAGEEPTPDEPQPEPTPTPVNGAPKPPAEPKPKPVKSKPTTREARVIIANAAGKVLPPTIPQLRGLMATIEASRQDDEYQIADATFTGEGAMLLETVLATLAWITGAKSPSEAFRGFPDLAEVATKLPKPEPVKPTKGVVNEEW